jgi:hypothetical protein
MNETIPIRCFTLASEQSDEHGPYTLSQRLSAIARIDRTVTAFEQGVLGFGGAIMGQSLKP